MRYKIRDILLVSSMYDYYLFEEDGRLYELIRQEYQTLNLSQAPEITHVTTGNEALDIALMEDRFDLVIVTLHIEDMHPVKFTQMMRQAGQNMPIILLAYDNKERKELTANYDASIFDRIFIWQGDYRLLIAIIKSFEDKLNVEDDSKNVGVQSIILVEDNVKFYSSYLPIVYREIFDQSQRLISEGVNLTHKFLRMRARPKILLCTTFEEAWDYFEKYREYILGVITDVNFKYKGKKDPEAGLKFIRRIRGIHEDIPVLVQSSNSAHELAARSMGAGFLLKGSPQLLHLLREFMLDNFGFGDFIFRTADGKEVSRAYNLKTLEEQLQVVPGESIEYHAERNHFSSWLKARTEFWLAQNLRPRKVSDFSSVEGLRQELLTALRTYCDSRQRGVTTDFNRETFDNKYGFARIGQGSLGGKARGLGFINTLMNNTDIRGSFSGIEIYVPAALILTTDIFDRFIEDNNLQNFAYTEVGDKEILHNFLADTLLPAEVFQKLKDFLTLVHEPLAVRSSSLLEDSQFQPFAGVYDTFMIPNNNSDINIRLEELCQTIKCVYASTFFKKARDYMKSTEYRLEEEKMAVIIQHLVGTTHGNRFYPDISGVAKSYNFYPIAPQKAADGIAHAALGLGKTVVEGGNTVRFCPAYPKHLMQFFSVKETVRSAQQKFYALTLDQVFDLHADETPDDLVKEYKLEAAEQDGSLTYVGSTYSAENEAVYDGISRKGVRVVTFAPILKHNIFPLSEVLLKLLAIGSWGMGTQVEIEFAVDLNLKDGGTPEFAMLQMRPLLITEETEAVKIENHEKDELLCESTQILGNGAYDKFFDIIVVDYNKFERGKSREVAEEVAKFNEKLTAARRPYILIGVGRWGSLDQWLGIPVSWDQISGASVIVESGFKDFAVTPSQGSHFFQNLTSFRIGYITIDPHQKLGFVDWEWLAAQPAVEEKKFTRHLEFTRPACVRLDGHQGKGIILKPKEQ
ncbi:MAG: histidine kinase [Ignavibacteriales bacterium]|nr:histidine kinase [Ignavibacteriales bacterium]